MDHEVGRRVAIEVALDEAAGEAQLAGHAGEGAGADEAECLVARQEAVGIDRRDVDAIALLVRKTDDIVVQHRARIGGLLDGRKHERIGAAAPRHRVGALVADQPVVTAAPGERVVEFVTPDRVVQLVAGADEGGGGEYELQVLDIGTERVVEGRKHQVRASPASSATTSPAPIQ
jgi:hypothetical protein